MPDLSQSIGDFIGESEIGGEAVAWLNNLNTTATYCHHWPKELKLQMARRHLIGPAHDWLLRTEFETLFQKTFRTESSYSQRFAQMQALIQNKGESTSAYFHNKVRRCRAVNLEIEDIKEQVLLGLWSHELACSLLVAKRSDTDELLADIMAFERIQKGRADNQVNEKPIWRGRVSKEPDKNNVKPTANHIPIKSGTSDVHNTSGMTAVGAVSSIKCWNCRKTGHSRRDCPSSEQIKM